MIITLLGDGGTQDPYVGIMKGVILKIAPAVRLVDLTHEVPPQDVLTGALLLRSAVRYLPGETIHVAVVDPGVGSAREAVVVTTETGVAVVRGRSQKSGVRTGEVWVVIDRIAATVLVTATLSGSVILTPGD